MVDTVANSEQILLTYKDVVEAHPEWTDQAVEDYLATKRDIVDATETADKAVDTSNSSVLVPALIKRLEDLENARPINYGAIALDYINRLSLESIDITADFTTSGNQFITCNNTSGIAVTLNPYPEDLEKITIKRNAIGSVSFVGNIDGNTNEYIASIGDGIDLVYADAMGYWGAV